MNNKQLPSLHTTHTYHTHMDHTYMNMHHTYMRPTHVHQYTTEHASRMRAHIPHTTSPHTAHLHAHAAHKHDETQGTPTTQKSYKSDGAQHANTCTPNLPIDGNPRSVLVGWFQRSSLVGIHQLQVVPHQASVARLDQVPFQRELLGTVLGIRGVLERSLLHHALHKGPEVSPMCAGELQIMLIASSPHNLNFSTPLNIRNMRAPYNSGKL